MSTKYLSIGLFGFGCVGQALHANLQAQADFPASIRRICVRDPHITRTLSADHFTCNRADLLDDPEIDVIVELIDDAEAAYAIVTGALKRGKAVVTANKKLVATHFEELIALQIAHGAPLLYEGACCAAIPVIRCLEQYYAATPLSSLTGILNGSTNCILDAVAAQGQSYGEALAAAQAAGFAEADPRLDVEGYDASYKLCLLIAHAFGQYLPPERILRFGIAGLGLEELRFAQARGWKLKLVAQARKANDETFASVLPQFLRTDHPLYGVNGPENSVLIQGKEAQPQVFRGQGAGGSATASAVLADLSALQQEYRYGYRKWEAAGGLSRPGAGHLRVYFRYRDPADLVLLRFAEIEESYRGQGTGHVIGRVAVSDLRAFQAEPERGGVFVAEVPEARIVRQVVASAITNLVEA